MLAVVLSWVIVPLTVHAGQRGPVLPPTHDPDRPAQVSSKAAADKIHAHVLADTADGHAAQFLVILAEQADLRGAERLATKEAKGASVFQSLRQTAARTQGPILRLLNALSVPYRSNYITNSITVTGNRAAVEALAAHPLVEQLDPDRPFPFNGPLPPDDTRRLEAPAGVEWNLTWIHADAVWALGYTGQGAVIANADTGVHWEHPALKPQYRGWDGTAADHNFHWWDAIHTQIASPASACGYNLPAPCDDNGHGTHTTGTAVGDDGGDNRIGVAPGARWIGCRNMDAGVGRPSTYLECLEFFLAPWDLNGLNANPALAPDVLSNSYICPPDEGCSPRSLQAGVQHMRAAGIVMAVAAGNSGPGCSSVSDPPAIYNASTSVGALETQSDTIASFSSRGPVGADGSDRRKPDLVAPGSRVRSSIPPDDYTTLSGTSMATPHVAGAVALLVSARPALRGHVAALERALFRTARHIFSSECGSHGLFPNNVYGWGVLDVGAAVNALLGAP